LPAARVAESPWASLPADGDLYLYADVRQARGLLEPLASDFGSFAAWRDGRKARRLGPLLDRSEEVYACLYLPASGAKPGEGSAAAKPGEAGGPAAELAVTGRWSPSLVSARLNFSCGWARREPAPGVWYWSARRSALEVGSPAAGLLLAAVERPGALEGMTDRRRSPQAGPVERTRADDPRVDPFLAGAALYAFLPAAGEASVAEPAGGLPVRELWLAARHEQDQYDLGALAALTPAVGAPDAPSARALTVLVRLAAAAWLRKAGIPEVAARLRAMEIEVDAGGLTVRGLRLAEAELLALLQGVLRSPAEDSDARGGD
jgi:hypothetical protein